MNCTFFKRRSKNYKYYFYCTKLKKEITFDDCKGCDFKEYKKNVSKSKKNGFPEEKSPKTGKKGKINGKSRKKAPKKRLTVSKETYDIVYNESQGRCGLCSATDNLQLHHINGRGKFLTDDPNNCIMLCMDCHHNKVHKNNKYYRPILLDIKKEYN